MPGDDTTSASLLRPQPSSPDLVVQKVSSHANYGRCFFDGVGESLEVGGSGHFGRSAWAAAGEDPQQRRPVGSRGDRPPGARRNPAARELDSLQDMRSIEQLAARLDRVEAELALYRLAYDYCIGAAAPRTNLAGRLLAGHRDQCLAARLADRHR